MQQKVHREKKHTLSSNEVVCVDEMKSFRNDFSGGGEGNKTLVDPPNPS